MNLNDEYLLINPNSGRFRRKSGIFRRGKRDLEDLVKEARRVGCERDVTENGDGDLEDKVSKSVTRGDKLVIISSGDGGLGVAVTKYINAIKDIYGARTNEEIEEYLPTFLVVPSGTVNVVANNVGVKGNPAKIFSKVIKAYRDKGINGLDIKKRRILEVQEGSRQSKYGFMFAKGAVDNFMDLYYGNTEKQKKKENYGLLTFVNILSRAVVGYFGDLATKVVGVPFNLREELFSCYHHCIKPEHLELTVDGKPVHNYAKREEGVSATNNEYFGAFVATNYFKIFGMKPLHAFKDGNKEGNLQVLAGTTPLHKFVYHLPKVWFGKPFPFTNYLDTVANEVSFTPSPGDKHRYSLDAELSKPMPDTVYVRQGPMVKFATLPAK